MEFSPSFSFILRRYSFQLNLKDTYYDETYLVKE